MDPNSALSAGQLAIIAVVAIVCLAIWLGGVFVAAREPRRESSAGTASLPQHPSDMDEPQRKVALSGAGFVPAQAALMRRARERWAQRLPAPGFAYRAGEAGGPGNYPRRREPPLPAMPINASRNCAKVGPVRLPPT
ncbi:MAG: hypothetical protein ACRDOB_20585 [Streptosporangiaceae bacterium]